jgi:GntR family transcriptional regulator, rspAB operon transcriptional repressor
MPEPIRLDRYRQVSPQLYESLRAMILSLELAPGTTLVRSEIAARFGVSQTPVRDALQKLQHEGLVEIFPQAATQVSKIDLASATQAHFLRRSIETELVRLLATKPDAQLVARLREWVAREMKLAADRDLEGFSQADQGFHLELYQACGQQALYDVVRSMSGHIDRLRRLHVPTKGKVQRIIADHKAIVEAIAAGTPARAQERLREHLSGTLAQADAIRQAHPDYFSS